MKPVAPYISHDHLWELRNESIARGVAAGLFFGILIPVAQFFFAAVLAVMVRGNLPVAMVATFVSNPVTMPLIYWAAYVVGDALIGGVDVNTPVPNAVSDWWDLSQSIPRLSYWWSTTGASLLMGLFVIAVGSALLVYLGLKVFWRDRPRVSSGE